MKYPKELLLLERHAFAVMQAMPELKAAHDSCTGTELFERLEEIEVKYGLSVA